MDFLSVALYVLSWIMTLIFLRAGLVKVTSRLFSKDHKETRQEFAQYANVCPTVLFGITLSPDGYMFLVGVIETLASILLLVPYTDLHTWMYLVFCVMLALSIYTHDVLEQYFKMVYDICLFLTFIVLYKVGPIALTNQENDLE
uniref:DoxX family protein n=1 Tax=Magallana gigas TaxID=29159 RepID=A0A8W8J8E6_MAGGI